MLPIVLWHGAHRWQAPPEVRPAAPTSSEHGPGIYMTTSSETAREFAKGGGSLVRFELDPNLTLIEDVWIPLDDALDFVRSRSRLRRRRELEEDLRRVAARYRQGQIARGTYRGTGPLTMPASVLVNLFVNYRLITGAHGPALARFLVERGADADVVTRGTDDWLVLFNPKKIQNWRVVPYGQSEDAPRLRGRWQR